MNKETKDFVCKAVEHQKQYMQEIGAKLVGDTWIKIDEKGDAHHPNYESSVLVINNNVDLNVYYDVLTIICAATDKDIETHLKTLYGDYDA
jgi:hypothetical protein